MTFQKCILACWSLFLIPFATWAANIPVAFVSWDITTSGTAGQFDIANETGPNSSGDSTFPVTTPVGFGNLALNVQFSDGSSRSFDGSAFMLNPFDGLSFESPSIPLGGQNSKPLQAALTGTFLTTSVTLFDGSHLDISPDFTASVFSGGQPLADGDLAVIFAVPQETPSTPSVPEPASWALMSIALIGLFLSLRYARRSAWRLYDHQ